MAYIRALIFCCIALTSLKITSGFDMPGFPNLNMSGLGFPQIPGFGSGFPMMPFNMFGSPNFSLPFFPSFSGEGRSRRDTESAAEKNETDHQDRFFFALFPTITSCNTTEQGGRSCLNCRQALNCLANNLGLLTTCRGLFQYCDQGRCVFNRPSNCTS